MSPAADGSVEHGRWPRELLPVFEKWVTCEYAGLTRSGAPITWPVGPFVGADGRTLDLTTGLSYPSKAERARRDPRVALLFSDPTGTGLADPPTVLVQGLATVRDADLQANTDRYVSAVEAKYPGALGRQPRFLLRRQAWYWTRIWIEVTPLRILWWPGGRLDAPPSRWEAAGDVVAPPSDPGPPGSDAPGWLPPPADWRPRADQAVRHGAPVLTVTDVDGWPLPLRTLGAERVADGFVVRTGPIGVIARGRACLTFHSFDEDMNSQDNVVLVGEATPVAGGVHVRVERALGDFSLSGSALRQMLKLMSSARVLRPRLTREAARRGQRIPELRLPGE
ncbi:hemerythrin [Nonomuraea sp. NN258]|nr:hemerythrin [Nonomuraea antri]